tara:strand:- start:1691 stop:1912 length:222 start_codon:yes stop_codon:yes gene_type:complete
MVRSPFAGLMTLVTPLHILPSWRFSVKVGNLVKMKSGGTVWLMLDIVADTILVLNQRTKYKMWADMSAFEVIA